MSQMTGQQRIENERKRQIESEGWLPEHDDQRGPDELELAALCYRDAADENCELPAQWPWGPAHWKPKCRSRNLERAGALYQAAAEAAERAGNYSRRDSLRDQVESCAIRLESIQPARS